MYLLSERRSRFIGLVDGREDPTPGKSEGRLKTLGTELLRLQIT